MSPAVGGWSHTRNLNNLIIVWRLLNLFNKLILDPIEPTEQYRRPRDNSYYYESPFTSARTGGSKSF